MFAHKLQRCNNFKDPGVQVYRGDMFSRTRDLADAIFDTLPPPVPTGHKHSQGSYRGPTSMSAYNNCYGGCIDGSSQVQLASGDLKCVKDLACGDFVCGLPQPNGCQQTALVTCVVRSDCPQGRCPMVELSSGLRLTPYHPVFLNGSWHFPANLAAVKMHSCDAVYSFVLQG